MKTSQLKQGQKINQMAQDLSCAVRGLDFELIDMTKKELEDLRKALNDHFSIVHDVLEHKQPKVKRLSHQRFMNELEADIGVVSEWFKIGEPDRAVEFDGETYYPMCCNRNSYCQNKINYALWINYGQRKIIIEYENHKDQFQFVAIAKRHYLQKGYQVVFHNQVISI